MKNHLINSKTNLREALESLSKTNSRILFIVDDNKKLLGSLTDIEVRKWILANKNLDTSVTNAMNCNPEYVLVGQEKQSEKNTCVNDAIPVVNASFQIINIVFKKEQKQNNIDVPVVIMAGGKGERLRPYTDIVPKPLIPINQKPISELVIESFYKFGCKNYFFTLGYKKNMIKAYYDGIERDYSITYIEEDEPLGTGGSLYYLKDILKSTFFVSNCDILLKINYEDVLKFHKDNSNTITIVTSLKQYTIPYGIVELSCEGTIKNLAEKPSINYLVNTGVYVLEPDVFNYVKEKNFIHLTHIIEKCLKDGKKIGTYPVSEEAWLDMGQFKDMARMKEKVAQC